VLVPPSLTKSTGGRRAASSGLFEDELAAQRDQVRAALGMFLQTASPKQLETVLNARGPLLARAVEASERLVAGDAPLTPAWRRYQGVVWSHLDPGTLTPGLRRRILVPSGVYGLVSSDDAVADYRLRMNVGLSPLGGLATFWRPNVTRVLATYLVSVPLVNLLPQEHAASIDLRTLAERRRVINVHFVAKREQRAVGHDAKAVKGVITRRLLTDGLDSIDQMTWHGWTVRRERDELFVSAPL
jgi:cytoplasmic iron level regulating protein YaaA (DUF328/UPF0246 family)